MYTGQINKDFREVMQSNTNRVIKDKENLSKADIRQALDDNLELFRRFDPVNLYTFGSVDQEVKDVIN